jgi:hypothetical protein
MPTGLLAAISVIDFLKVCTVQILISTMEYQIGMYMIKESKQLHSLSPYAALAPSLSAISDAPVQQKFCFAAAVVSGLLPVRLDVGIQREALLCRTSSTSTVARPQFRAATETELCLRRRTCAQKSAEGQDR